MSRKVLRVGEFEVDIHHVRWVEAELKRHQWRKQRIRYLEDRIGGQSRMDIILATPTREPGMPGAPGPGNPTFNTVSALLMQPELVQLKLITSIIDDVYSRLPEIQQEIIRMFYFERRYTLDGIAYKLEKNVRTILRQRDQALLAFVIAMVGDWAVRNVTKSAVQGQETAL